MEFNTKNDITCGGVLKMGYAAKLSKGGGYKCDLLLDNATCGSSGIQIPNYNTYTIFIVDFRFDSNRYTLDIPLGETRWYGGGISGYLIWGTISIDSNGVFLFSTASGIGTAWGQGYSRSMANNPFDLYGTNEEC